MLPEMQIVKHDLTAGCSPLSRDIGRGALPRPPPNRLPSVGSANSTPSGGIFHRKPELIVARYAAMWPQSGCINGPFRHTKFLNRLACSSNLVARLYV